MRLNMNTVVGLVELVLPDLLVTCIKLLNTASTAFFQPGPHMVVHEAQKVSVLSFSEAIASELEDTGVTVTVTAPRPGSKALGSQDKADLSNSALVKGKKLPTSVEMAALGYEAMQREQQVCIRGLIDSVMVQSVRITPRHVATTMVKHLYNPTA